MAVVEHSSACYFIHGFGKLWTEVREGRVVEGDVLYDRYFMREEGN